MAQNIIDKINNFSSYKFDFVSNRVINLKSQEHTNIDEFLEIQFLLDNNMVKHYFVRNFEIQIIK